MRSPCSALKARSVARSRAMTVGGVPWLHWYFRTSIILATPSAPKHCYDALDRSAHGTATHRFVVLVPPSSITCNAARPVAMLYRPDRREFNDTLWSMLRRGSGLLQRPVSRLS